MRWFSYSALAVIVSGSFLDGAGVYAQALTRTAETVRENVAESNFDRLRSAAYASYTRQEYALQADGNLRGTVRNIDSAGGLSPARVKLFFVQHGEIISQATPTREGNFQATGLTPGVYSVIGYGESGFSATGIRVVPPPEKSPAPKTNTIGRERLVADTTLDAAGSLNLTPIPTIDVAPAFGLSRMINGEQSPPAPTAAAAQQAKPGLASFNAAENKNFEFNDSHIAEIAIMDAYERNAYHLEIDGMLSAQLRSFNGAGVLAPSPFTSIYFLRQGRVVAQGRTDELGYYNIAGLTPGYYSFVAAGQGNFGAVGITILPAVPVQDMPVPKTKSIGKVRTISLLDQGSGEGQGGGGGAGPAGGGTGTGNVGAGVGAGGGGGAGGAGAGAGAGGGGAAGGGAGGGGVGGAGGLGGGLGGFAAVAGGIGAAAAAAGSDNGSGGGSSNGNSGSGNPNTQ